MHQNRMHATSDGRPHRSLPRVLTGGTAKRLGIGRDAVQYRVRSGRWLRLAPGVYLTEPPAQPTDRCIGAALHGGPRAVVSGEAALFQYGLLPREPAQDLVLVPLPAGAGSWGRIRVRATPILPLNGPTHLPLAPVARAVSDYAHELRWQSDATAVVTASIQRRLCTLVELDAEFRRGAQRGSRALRIALEDAGYGAHSEPEAVAGRLLRGAGLGAFSANARIDVEGCSFYGDLVWRHLQAVIEVDSTEHHFSPADQTATLRRDHVLQMAGWSVLHVTPSQLRDGDAFVTLVRRWLTVLQSRLNPS